MNKIIIKCCPYSKFLRTEGISRAIEYEETFMSDGRKPGVYNGVVWSKFGNKGSKWSTYVYHTKNGAIVVTINKDV